MIDNLYDEDFNKWGNSNIMENSYVCGYCGHEVSSDEGMPLLIDKPGHITQQSGYGVYVCTHCHMPTFIYKDIQVPGNRYGDPVQNVPNDVNSVYEEARSSFAAGAYTGVVLLCRKLLMHIATDLGADTNLRFVQYVNYLNEHHYAGARSDQWVDQIRQFGNQANHEIRINTKEEAQRIIKFCEMILRLNYEYPSIASNENNDN
ncbi:DUF4145 domain-containing protein [Limosilactobacillus vaginalis]|uniref:DUF4145 domain-containing protein n=1 Tax=Limosilactobacillus vaginalis TaxID=1633 RepID=UPI00235890F5|nr:DUF4145 domain-containing protein [Limosilactobacillus vaginalis]WCT58830.1 DUF4145 domain-containing protein [Limosilactobacillus vaginalis]